MRQSDLFLGLGCLTNSVAQIEEFRAAYLTDTGNLYLYNIRRVDGERLLNAHAVSNSSYGKGLGNTAVALCNESTLEQLDSLLDRKSVV